MDNQIKQDSQILRAADDAAGQWRERMQLLVGHLPVVRLLEKNHYFRREVGIPCCESLSS